MGDIKASLYDIFGYLFPGLFAVIAFRLLVWVTLYPNTVLNIAPLSNTLVISGIGVVAYIMGHLTHAIGNWLPYTKSTKFEADDDEIASQNPKSLTGFIKHEFRRVRVSKQMLSLTDQAIKDKFGEEYAKLSSEEKFGLLDEYRTHCGKDNEREVFVYREGFYRGMVVACSMLFIAILLSLFCSNLSVITGKEVFSVSRSERFYILVLTALAVAGFWRRMIRFTHYRLSRAATLFLVLVKKTQ